MNGCLNSEKVSAAYQNSQLRTFLHGVTLSTKTRLSSMETLQAGLRYRRKHSADIVLSSPYHFGNGWIIVLVSGG